MYPNETRCWHRKVTQLGNRAFEKAFQSDLETLFPVTLYQFNIAVWGGSDTTEVSVCIWRERPFIQIDGPVEPEDCGGDLSAAILQRLTDSVEDFNREPSPMMDLTDRIRPVGG